MFILRLNKIEFKIVTLAVLFVGLTLLDRSAGVSQMNLKPPLEQIATDEKVIALTINVDWGGEYIQKILEVMTKYEAKATFFVTGRWAQNNPELLKLIVAQGHQIENHGYYHSHPDKLPVEKTKEELIKTEKVIMDSTSKKTSFYAPPYGERGLNGLKAADNLGYITVLWTIDTVDWMSQSTPDIIAQRILEPKIKFGIKPDRNGAIVLMHPKENTVKALPRILSRLREEGYKMVTIEKLITY
jgi:peptidoglycan/xylan/chitin deacetylase (PgdA/CDA1 family)